MMKQPSVIFKGINMKSNRFHGVFYTQRNIQSTSLKNLLTENSDIKLIHLSPISLYNKFNGNESEHSVDIIIIDHDEMIRYPEISKKIADTNTKQKPEIIINCPPEVKPKDLIAWRSLSGIFYQSDSIDTLFKGINKIISGEMWFTRELSQQLITLYRKDYKVKGIRSFQILTTREQQIMSFVAQGKSNFEISEYLFVSENTIKTHLHHIFKKINVKNRVQAMLWLGENVDYEAPEKTV